MNVIRVYWAAAVSVGILLSLLTSTFAGEPPRRAEAKLRDLSLGNLFSAGWSEPWQKRPRPDGAPDLALLRVQANFLARAVRTDFFVERPLAGSGERSVDFLQGLIEVPVNRRLMLALIASDTVRDLRDGEREEGSTWGGFARLQLIDTEHTSYALNLRAVAPNRGLGEKRTTLSLALAGWHDLAPLGLGRTGIHWHVQAENYRGPHPAGARENDVTAAAALTHTWTRPEAVVGNFTTFAEAYARTDLDGKNAGRSTVTITPGLRATFAHRHTFIAGLEVPVSSPRPYERLVRVSYIVPF